MLKSKASEVLRDECILRPELWKRPPKEKQTEVTPVVKEVQKAVCSQQANQKHTARGPHPLEKHMILLLLF